MSPATREMRNPATRSRTTASRVSDESLLLDYRRSGDHALFRQLVRRYERDLYDYLRWYLRDAEMAEDVFQATFLQVHLKCDQFGAGRRVRPWLYRIATNQAIDAVRRARRHRLTSLDTPAEPYGMERGTLVDIVPGDEPNPLAHLEHEERRAWTRGAVDRLPRNLREVVRLVFFQGMRYADAAEVLSLPIGTVKSRMHAAFGALGRAFQASDWHEPPREREPTALAR